MFKRISIILLVLLTLLAFTAGVSAAGIFIEKATDGSSIDYVDSSGTSIFKIEDDGTVTTRTAVTGDTYTSMTVTSTTDASSLTTGSVTTAGGMSVAKQLYLGDDLDMTVSGTGVYEITLNDAVADALSITREGTDIIVFDTSTPRVTITPATTITGLLTLNGGLKLGADGAGFDVTLYGDNSGSDFVWDQDGDTDASLTLGTTGGTKGVDFKVYGEASGTFLHWDRSVDDLLLGGAVTRLIISGTVDTSLTDASIVTSGGIACTKQLWLGDDIDMSTSASGVYEITLRDTVDDALSIMGGGTDMMLFDTDTDQITFTPEVLFKDDIDLTTSTTGVYELTLNNNQADALSICDSTGDLIKFDTTTGILATTVSTFITMGTESVGIATTTANPFTVEVHTEPLTTLTAGATGHSAGIRSRYHVTVAQANTISICAVEARLRVKHALADGVHSAISGVIEASSATADFTGSATTVRTAGFFALDFDALGSLADDGWLTGVTIDSSVDGSLSMSAVQFAGLRITGGSTKEDWEQGIVIDDGVAVIGMQIGNATTGILLDGTFTTGLQVTGTLGTAAARAIKSNVTINNCNLTDGYGTNEFDLTITGTGAGHIAATSSWLNIGSGTHGAGGSFLTPLTVGVWEAIGATVTGATIIFGMRMQSIVADVDAARLCPFDINVSGDTIDAIWNAPTKAHLGYAADSTIDSTKCGDIPFMIDSNGAVFYIRIYDSAS